MFTTTFNGGVFEAKLGDRVVVHQPFRPTSTGEQVAWADEAEALAWWESNKSQFAPPPEPEPTPPPQQ